MSFNLVLEMDDAGIDLGFDDDVDIATQATWDEEDAIERGLDKLLSPPLFFRTINRGTLEVQAPTISTINMCCGKPDSVQLATLDGTNGVFALTHALYPFFREETVNASRMVETPCGMLFGSPFWRHTDHEKHRFILLKTVSAGFSNDSSVARLFKSHPSFESLLEEPRARSFCIAMLIWAEGRYAERKGLAILEKTFWDSRRPVIEDWELL